MKPHIKFDKNTAAPNGRGFWLCGGVVLQKGYIDWFAANTPKEAYEIWAKVKEQIENA